MALKFLENLNIYKAHSAFSNTDFIVGKDSFEDLHINSAQETGGFWYFKNSKKGLVIRFVIQRSAQIEKACTVTLIKGQNGKFTPRFDFQIWNITNKGTNDFLNGNLDQNLIKAKVSLDSCHENFLLLLNFMRCIEEIDILSTTYAVMDKKKKDEYDDLGDHTKLSALLAVQKKFGSEISESDVVLLLDRKSKLDYFKKLLDDESFFTEQKLLLEKETKASKRIEDVWQNFFENNQWIFGYGLHLVSCESLDDKKLEQTVVGNDIVDGSGKRIDALLKTKGNISKFLFCEIKTHLPDLLIEPYDRPGVFVPAKELRGAVAQIQKTIHKVTSKIQQNFIKPVDKDGTPSDEEILFVKPRGVVVIGMLNDFKTDTGINYEKLSSFEIYRQQINGVDILTYDELYERAKFIVENN